MRLMPDRMPDSIAEVQPKTVKTNMRRVFPGGVGRHDAPKVWTNAAGQTFPVLRSPRLRWDKGAAKPLRAHVLARDAGTCRMCRVKHPLGTLMLYRIVGMAEGGSNHPENFVTLCRGCCASVVGSTEYYTPELPRKVSA